MRSVPAMMGWRRRLGLGVVVMAVLASVADAGVASGPAGAEVVAAGKVAPEIASGAWVNSEPLSLQKLRGRVVLIEFWTYGCYNCKNVVPHLRAWHERYAGQGLTIVGVHTPEFFWEKPYEKVAAATRELGIAYPVVQDNDFLTWKRFGVWAWPTAVLIDKRGVVRFRHVGEGAYDDMDAMIRRLLAERQ